LLNTPEEGEGEKWLRRSPVDRPYKESEPKIILVQWQLMMPQMSLKLKKITLTSIPISFNTKDGGKVRRVLTFNLYSLYRVGIPLASTVKDAEKVGICPTKGLLVTLSFSLSYEHLI
jgi:hypothetical protein